MFKAYMARGIFLASGIIAERLDTYFSKRGKLLHPAIYWVLGLVGMGALFILGGYKGIQ